MKRMNNKGFTLIEMILSLAILMFVMAQLGSIMYSTTRLYRNGSSEVTLQKEAQQVVSMVEELLMDCDNAVSYNASTKVMTIDNNASYLCDYVISQRGDKLYLKVKEGANESEHVLAEGVKSFGLETAALSYESRVIFSVEMEYDGYTYASEKDIYLRNHIGTNDSGLGDGYKNKSSDDTADSFADETLYPLDVLRYKNYDLKETIPEAIRNQYMLNNCTFEIVERSVSTVDGHSTITYVPSSQDYYEMPDNKHVKATDSLNVNLNGTGSDYVLLRSTENTKFFVQCRTTDAVFGSQIYEDSGVGSITLDPTSTNTMAIITFESCNNSNKVPLFINSAGLSLEACKSIEITPMIKFSDADLDLAGKDNMHYYKITYDGETDAITPTDPELVDLLGTPTSSSKYYGYTSGDVCIALCDPIVMSGNPLQADSSKIKSKTIRIRLAEGGTGTGDDFEPTEAMFDKDTKTFEAFQISYDFGSVQYGVNNGKSGMFVDKSTNALAVTTGLYNFSQSSNLGIDEKLGRASLFYEMGGELFFDIKLVYDGGSVNGDQEFHCKAIFNVTCSKGDCGAITSNAQEMMKKAISSGMETNVEKVGGVPTYKDGKGPHKTSGGSGSATVPGGSTESGEGTTGEGTTGEGTTGEGTTGEGTTGEGTTGEGTTGEGTTGNQTAGDNPPTSNSDSSGVKTE